MPKPEIHIREFTEADRPVVKQLYLQSRVDTFYWLNTRNFKLNDFEKDTKGERLLVAEQHGRIAGFIGVWMADNFIHHLYVSKDAVRRGIGKALLDAALQLSPKPFSLKCLELNISAYDFYASQGWQIKRKGIGDNGPYFLLVSR